MCGSILLILLSLACLTGCVSTEKQTIERASDVDTKKRIFLVRSGSFSPHFIKQMHALYPLREGDLVARCKNTSGNNLTLFKGQTDLLFVRYENLFLKNNLSLRNSSLRLSKSALAIVEVIDLEKLDSQPSLIEEARRQEKFPALSDFNAFCKVNHFHNVQLMDIDYVARLFEERTKIAYDRLTPGHAPSLGLLALIHLRKDFPEYKLVLVDFTFEGWDGHPWEEEKNIALELEKEGHLLRVIQDRFITLHRMGS